MGLAVGRWDWWRLKDEHTPYEWLVQQLAEQVEPIGDNRADMRAARNTVAILSALVPDLSSGELAQKSQELRNYLEVNQPEDRVLTPEEAAEEKRRLGHVG